YILGRLLIDHDTVAVFLQPEEEAGKNLRELRTSRSGDYGCGLLTICLRALHGQRAIVQKKAWTKEDTEDRRGSKDSSEQKLAIAFRTQDGRIDSIDV